MTIQFLIILKFMNHKIIFLNILQSKFTTIILCIWCANSWMYHISIMHCNIRRFRIYWNWVFQLEIRLDYAVTLYQKISCIYSSSNHLECDYTYIGTLKYCWHWYRTIPIEQDSKLVMNVTVYMYILQMTL